MKKLLLSLSALFLFASLAGNVLAIGSSAGSIGSIGSDAQLWRTTATGAYLIPTTNSAGTVRDIGATGDRIPNGFFTNLDTTTLALGGAVTSDVHVNDDFEVTFGNTFAAPDVRLGWNTAQTVDALYLGLSTGQNTFIIGELGDIAFDFAHGAQTNPTLFIHSAVQSTTQWFSAAHNQTNVVLGAGAGGIVTAANVMIGGALTAVPASTLYIVHPNTAAGGIRLQSNETDTTAKMSRIKTGHYTNAEEPVTLFLSNVGLSENVLYIGGSVSTENSLTNIRFYTGTTNTTVTGTERGRINSSGNWIFGTGEGLATVGTEGVLRSVDLTTGGAGNVAGTDFTIMAGLGTGTGDEGTIIFQLPIVAAVGDNAQTRATRLTLDMAGSATVLTMAASQGLTISTAPNATMSFTQATGTTGATGFTFNIGAHTAITAATERIGINIPAVTQTWAAGAGPLANQRKFVLAANTYVGDAGGALTITLATSFSTQLPIAGANLTETVAAGIGVVAAVGGAGTITGTRGIFIEDQSLAGSATSYALNILSQTANATITRAINIVGTGVNNGIRLGDSPNIYSTGANTIRFSDATVANGLIFTLAATAVQSINTISGTNGEIRFQNQTFTPGAAHSAISMNSFWATENFNHTAFSIIPTQNAGNTEELRAIAITMTKATGATTLGEMIGILLASPSVAGFVTDNAAISILAQGNAGIVNNRGILIGDVGNAASTLSFAIDIASQTASITTSRAIRIIGTGAANAIELGDSPLIYSSGAEVIRFDDSTAARGISFTLTAAGIQTIAPTAGDLAIGVAGTNIAVATTTATYDIDSWSTGTTTMRISSTVATRGGCIILKDVTNSTEYGVIISGGVLGTTTAANC